MNDTNTTISTTEEFYKTDYVVDVTGSTKEDLYINIGKKDENGEFFFYDDAIGAEALFLYEEIQKWPIVDCGRQVEALARRYDSDATDQTIKYIGGFRRNRGIDTIYLQRNALVSEGNVITIWIAGKEYLNIVNHISELTKEEKSFYLCAMAKNANFNVKYASKE